MILVSSFSYPFYVLHWLIHHIFFILSSILCSSFAYLCYVHLNKCNRPIRTVPFVLLFTSHPLEIWNTMSSDCMLICLTIFISIRTFCLLGHLVIVFKSIFCVLDMELLFEICSFYTFLFLNFLKYIDHWVHK